MIDIFLRNKRKLFSFIVSFHKRKTHFLYYHRLKNQSFSVTLVRKATTLCRRVFRTIGWCSGNDLETVLFAMLCLVLLRGLLFATKVHKNSNSQKFPSSFVGVLTQYKKKGDKNLEAA